MKKSFECDELKGKGRKNLFFVIIDVSAINMPITNLHREKGRVRTLLFSTLNTLL